MSTLTMVLLIALVVYLTRLSGYLVGLQFRHIGRLRPVLEALPGCAMVALIVPAVVAGSIKELLAVLFVVALMWRGKNLIVASMGGIGILLASERLFIMLTSSG